ncbi:hypothetical protein [Acinetobacter sp. YH12106]|uniref:hypothetical protein n=1 Tax=Acinetobacter sp. YH12106 TaxID=2601094 RepID=UPI0015D1C9D3|nr:hypothetical protein [Acinetobacter sp. YH12106]
MSDKIIVQYYEFCLKTRGENSKLPPIDHVNIYDTFTLIKENLNNLTQEYSYKNGTYSTTIEHLEITSTKIDIVFGYYDGLAPHRTLRDKITGANAVQRRGKNQSVKHLCHCVIKLDPNHPLLAVMGVEHVVGMPTSILGKTLNWYLRQLKKISSNSEGVFQVTNPDNANNPDGSPDIHKFNVISSFYPIAGELLTEAIKSGRLNKIRLKGKVTSNLNDPNQRLTRLSAALDFGITPLTANDTPQGYMRSLIDTAMRNKLNLDDITTFAIIENEAGGEQTIPLDNANSLNSAFVLKKAFDPTNGRIAHSDNTQINHVFLSEVWRLF